MYRTGPSFWGWHWEIVSGPKGQGNLRQWFWYVQNSVNSLPRVKLCRCQNDHCVTTQ